MKQEAEGAGAPRTQAFILNIEAPRVRDPQPNSSIFKIRIASTKSRSRSTVPPCGPEAARAWLKPIVTARQAGRQVLRRRACTQPCLSVAEDDSHVAWQPSSRGCLFHDAIQMARQAEAEEVELEQEGHMDVVISGPCTPK